MSSWKPNIFTYVNYREFMADYYTAAKENTASMSFRFLSRKAGFSSPNFYKLVMEGQRNLSKDGTTRVAAALDLGTEERTFFFALVDFDQAEDRATKNKAFERVSASRRFRSAGRIEPDLFEYLSHWYYPVIREMTGRADFRSDTKWIASQLLPKVKLPDVERAVTLLLKLGLVIRNDDGELERGDPTLTTGHEVNSLAIVNYHNQMIELGAKSMKTIARELRDISALTVCVRPDQVEMIKKRVHEFRETLIEVCESSDDPTTVYQLNIQLFPMNQTES